MYANAKGYSTQVLYFDTKISRATQCLKRPRMNTEARGTANGREWTPMSWGKKQPGGLPESSRRSERSGDLRLKKEKKPCTPGGAIPLGFASPSRRDAMRIAQRFSVGWTI